jgi:hypothetical protein
MERRDDDQTLDIPTPLGLLRTKGYRAMDVVLMVAVVAVVGGPAVGFYLHKKEMREQAEMFLTQLKQQAERNQRTLRDQDELSYKQIAAMLQSVRELTVAARYQACISALPEKQRWAELQRGGYCDQMARQGVIPP